MRCKILDELEGNEVLAKAIMTEDFLTILPEGAILKPEYIEKLKELEIPNVYVKETDEELKEVVILQEEIENTIKENIRDILERHTYHHNEELKELCETTDKIIGSIVQEKEVIEQVYDIKERNADIYEHSLSITTLAILTALKMDLSQEAAHDIGVGCLLHDIGLRYLSIDYVEKDLEELSESDKTEYMKHPIYGYSALKNENWLSELCKNIILCHHERRDGSGYPLHGTQFPVEVEIVNVCDVFDEMICGIGCKKVKVNEAIEFLKVFQNTKFSGTIVDTFLQFIAVYPVGTKVLTNEGNTAMVIQQNREFTDRPILRILADPDGKPVEGEVIQDLIKVHHVFVDKVLD